MVRSLVRLWSFAAWLRHWGLAIAVADLRANGWACSCREYAAVWRTC